VCLVRVAGVVGETSEARWAAMPDRGDEALEAEDSLESLGTVPRCDLAAPSQLAFTQPKPVDDMVQPCPGLGKQLRRGANGAVGGPLLNECERGADEFDAAPVRDAVAAYRNGDGRFGHGIEPDGRTPGSQPAAVELALRTLHQADAWDGELVAGACDWLERTAPAQGGVTFVALNVDGWPHAPWWQPVAGLPPSLLTTGLVAGTLHARGVEHPWLSRATDWIWSAIDALGEVGPYDMRGVLGFLQHVPDRVRAQEAFDTVVRERLDSKLVTLELGAAGEVHGPLDYAPLPDSIARPVFDDGTIADHLDHLAAAQRADGGWTFSWPAWSPLAELEWRGSITIEALVVLRANGRL
jgi:hypothetical protein